MDTYVIATVHGLWYRHIMRREEDYLNRHNENGNTEEKEERVTEGRGEGIM